MGVSLTNILLFVALNHLGQLQVAGYDCHLK